MRALNYVKGEGARREARSRPRHRARRRQLRHRRRFPHVGRRGCPARAHPGRGRARGAAAGGRARRDRSAGRAPRTGRWGRRGPLRGVGRDPIALTISVVIPVKNDADLLARCLRAIAGQTRRPDEIVVVDNGSSDDSARLVRDGLEGLLREAVGTGLPLLAVCLGAQLLADATGGRVEPAGEQTEVGPGLVAKRDSAVDDPLFDQAPASADVLPSSAAMPVTELPPGRCCAWRRRADRRTSAHRRPGMGRAVPHRDHTGCRAHLGAGRGRLPCRERHRARGAARPGRGGASRPAGSVGTGGDPVRRARPPRCRRSGSEHRWAANAGGPR